MRVFFTPLLLLSLLPFWAYAQTTCTAITGATALLDKGRVANVTVVLRGERIESVATNGAVPSACIHIDAKGLWITPGFIDPHTDIGLTEVGLEPRTRDADPGAGVPYKTPSVRPSFQVADAYNPRSSLIPLARYSGVTSTLIVPSGGIVSGQSAWADMAGARQADALRRTSVAVHASIGGSDRSRAASFHALRSLLSEARTFAKRRGDWEKARTQPFQFNALDLVAMAPVLNRSVPLVVRVHRASDIEALLRLADSHRLRLVIVGGGEAWMLAKELAKRQIGVVVNPLVIGPVSFDQVHARADNAALLERAGVPVMISTFWSHNVRTLAQVAGNAVRAGLPHDAAIRALTSTPAHVFGLKDHGVLRNAALANVVVWTGDPLELTSHPAHVWIHGRAIPLVTRQTILQEHYLKGGGTPDPLPLPQSNQTKKTPRQTHSKHLFTPGPTASSIDRLLPWLQKPIHSCKAAGPHIRIPVTIVFDGALRRIKQATIGAGKNALELRLRDTVMGIPLSDKLNQYCTKDRTTCTVWLAGCLGHALPVPGNDKAASTTLDFSVFRLEGPVRPGDKLTVYSSVLTSAQ
jgi:imidazolonepropionase-like amidohydrolase